ncbi:hypothetical protein XS74_25015 [Salmonella enterica subsp. enterica]|nr:hypothetical protein [Salmonella enterica subsp. enterica]
MYRQVAPNFADNQAVSLDFNGKRTKLTFAHLSGLDEPSTLNVLSVRFRTVGIQTPIMQKNITPGPCAERMQMVPDATLLLFRLKYPQYDRKRKPARTLWTE